MDLHSKMTTYVTSTITSPVTKTAKTSKWLRLEICNLQRHHTLKKTSCFRFKLVVTIMIVEN